MINKLTVYLKSQRQAYKPKGKLAQYQEMTEKTLKNNTLIDMFF